MLARANQPSARNVVNPAFMNTGVGCTAVLHKPVCLALGVTKDCLLDSMNKASDPHPEYRTCASYDEQFASSFAVPFFLHVAGETET